MTYASRKWHAAQTTDLAGSKYLLTVTGEVEVHRSNQEPKLTKAHPQGIVPTTLILDLSVGSNSDVGNAVMVWKPVQYSHEITAGQYDHVTIKGETASHTMKVERILS